MITISPCEIAGCPDPIRAALDAHPTEEVFTVRAGLYEVALDLDRTVQLLGDPGAVLVGRRDDRSAIRVGPSGVVVLEGLTLASNRARLIGVEPGASLTVSRCDLSGSAFELEGGLIRADGATLTLDESRLIGGFAADGGQVWARDARVEIVGSDLREGVATGGGGSIFAVASDPSASLTIIETNFSDHRSFEAGGAILAKGIRVSIDPADSGCGADPGGTTFEDNEAARGGAVAMLGLADLLACGTAFAGNVADSGGAMHLADAGGAVIDARFTANAALEGGALFLDATADLDVVRAGFCANRAEGNGGALAGTGMERVRFANARFVENEAGLSGGGAHLLGGSEIEFAHALFLGNRAYRRSAMDALGSGVLLRDSLVAYNEADGSIQADSDLSAVAVNADGWILSSAWWGNAPGDWFLYDSAHHLDQVVGNISGVDPGLRAWERDGLCPAGEDFFYPGPDSPLVDRATTGLDPDGSPADAGANGGPEAPESSWADFDRDNSPAVYDCDPGNPFVRPGIAEEWYDGADANCDGADDYDADGDGDPIPGAGGGGDCDDDPNDDPEEGPRSWEISSLQGDVPYNGIDEDCSGGDLDDVDGDGYPGQEANRADIEADCSDTDASRNPDAIETPAPVDQDCDGYEDVTLPLVPAACDGGAGRISPWSAILGIVGILGLRRRR